MGSKGAREVAAASDPQKLIDTDILIDAARGYSDAVGFLDGLRQTSGISISIIYPGPSGAACL